MEEKKTKPKPPKTITEREILVLRIEFHQKMQFGLEHYASLKAAGEESDISEQEIKKILSKKRIAETATKREISAALSDAAKFHKNQLIKYKAILSAQFGEDANEVFQENEEWYSSAVEDFKEVLTDPDFRSLLSPVVSGDSAN